MYNNILVPVALDHSSNLKASMEIAKRLLADGGKITLFNVVTKIPSYVEMELPKETQLRWIKESQTKLEGLARDYYPKAQCKVVEGHANHKILNYASEMEIDCIVMESHKPGLQDYLIGSTAARVVRHAKCAVHIIR